MGAALVDSDALLQYVVNHCEGLVVTRRFAPIWLGSYREEFFAQRLVPLGGIGILWNQHPL